MLTSALYLRRPRPENDPLNARAQERFDRREIPKPPAHLEGQREGAGQLGDDRPIGRGLAEGGVEIYHVEAGRAEGGPVRCHRERIVGEDRLGLGAPLPETHALPPAEIQRRDDHHASRSTRRAKFSRSLSPHRWLFSGWNWVPNIRPLPMTAGNGTP